VFLHAQIGEDNGYFNLEEVVASVSEKMIRRHPHVFGDVSVNNSDEVVTNWDAIKQQEKGKQEGSILKGEYRASSSLQTSFNYQKKAAKVGFDWPNAEDVWAKFEEEWKEFREEIQNGSEKTRIDEFGDVLFTLVNIARFYKISPEEAMIHANKKFASRFQFIEQKVKESGK
ncbi:MazG family protein, partial [Butyricicoccus sp. 1XD8-22]